MKDIVIATHGNLSYSFKETSELFVGPKDNIRCFGMTKEKSNADAKKELDDLISASDEDNLIVLTDLMGGSPANICMEMLMNDHHFELLSGLNLPMLVTLLTMDNDEISAKDLSTNLVTEGSNGITSISEMVRERGV